MKLKSTKWLLLLALVITIPLISGCFTILSIEQVETAEAGTQIQVYLEIRTEDTDENAHYGIFALLIPVDWAVDSVFFSGDFGPDYCTWLHPDSADGDPGGDVDYWYDSLDVRFPPPEGMHWQVYQSANPYASDLDTGYVDLYVDMTVGNTPGNYNLGYFVTNAALDFTDPSYYDVNLDNPIEVTGGAANLVTFQCNMSIQNQKGNFDPDDDKVVVRGNFNGWAGDAEQLLDPDADEIYTGTFDVGGEATIFYKHVIVKADESVIWEDVPNREFANVGAQVLPVVYFNDDSVIVEAADVTFQCIMSIKMREEVFKPDAGDIVVVRGNFNGWSGNADQLLDDATEAAPGVPGDSVYTGTFNVGADATIYFKYVIHKADGTDMWEGDPNRQFANTGQAMVLEPDYFDRDDEFSGVSKAGAILFNVDMEVWENAGFFDRNLDSLMIRGGFNGWASGDHLERFPGTMMYERTMPVEGIVGSSIAYKYYINYSDKTIWTNEDWGYEVPYTRGGGNRHIIFQGTMDQEAPIEYMNDIPHAGVIPAGHSMTLTFTVDMNPALTLATPFNPATDTVKLLPQDPHWAIGQGLDPYDDDLVVFEDPEGDGIYSGTMEITGPTIYGIEYAYRYGADEITEGGGFEFGRYRTRFIRPRHDGTFTDNWVFPIDTFQLDPPLVVEPLPEPMPLDVELVNGLAKPADYSLSQNYPNPFNPGTMISYAVPKFSFVTLKVYNMLGQDVATLVNEHKVAGKFNVSWDGKDYSGRAIAGGVYFYRIEAGDFSKTMKMLLLK